jgi:2-oxo-4-hydroxy-4-carboxy-5-ureidoimidazoline decarboxylase
VSGVLAGRPYRDRAELHRVSDQLTLALDDAALDEALVGHPRIGERRAHSTWSQQEQAGATNADDDLRAQLAKANAEYEQRFGHVYLVCATGKSAAELLAICQSRLTNDPATERDVVRSELAKINRLRLNKLLGESG